jgi:hypothetical protein
MAHLRGGKSARHDRLIDEFITLEVLPIIFSRLAAPVRQRLGVTATPYATKRYTHFERSSLHIFGNVTSSSLSYANRNMHPNIPSLINSQQS